MNFDQFIMWETTSRDTIDLKRVYIKLAGDHASAAMLSQIVYWYLPNRKGETKLRVKKEDALWLVKSEKDWDDECCLTPKQAERCINALKKLGIVETKIFHFARVPKTHIRINWPVFLQKMQETMAQNPSYQPEFSISPFGEVTEKPIPISPNGEVHSPQMGKYLYTENTNKDYLKTKDTNTTYSEVSSLRSSLPNETESKDSFPVTRVVESSEPVETTEDGGEQKIPSNNVTVQNVRGEILISGDEKKSELAVDNSTGSVQESSPDDEPAKKPRKLSMAPHAVVLRNVEEITKSPITNYSIDGKVVKELLLSHTVEDITEAYRQFFTEQVRRGKRQFAGLRFFKGEAHWRIEALKKEREAENYTAEDLTPYAIGKRMVNSVGTLEMAEEIRRNESRTDDYAMMLRHALSGA